uniref:Methionine aminopeptidase n=1 Tax=Pyramimonas obovata TaxID=1411642 RepID=A0A7S0WWE2_9CHLO|mmetsp:Transcript_6888/g.13919  ORF Transcript_6888/g.13919 Transcript_6888/m.13919 type:complete len:371 (+) Transcript_6888:98-1210(+)
MHSTQGAALHRYATLGSYAFLRQRQGCAGAMTPKRSTFIRPEPQLYAAASPSRHYAGRRTFLEVLAAKGFGDLLAARQGSKKPSGEVRKRLIKGQLAPPAFVPLDIDLPPYAKTKQNPPYTEKYEVHDEEGIKKMRAAGKLAKEVLDYAGTLVKPGITTNDIDVAVHKMIIDNGAYPSPLNYGGFPKSVCTSLNECICHGIPDTTVIEDGDIINVDVTVYLNGHHGDTSRTFIVGKASDEAKRLVQVTKEALDKAIEVCGPGVPFKEIGKAIHNHADANKLGVVRNFVGHGVGKVFHAGPAVLHYRNNERGKMEVGQTFTIEPMLTLGSTRERYWKDNWTAVTEDGSWTAQFEHTLLITPDGVEILTAYE